MADQVRYEQAKSKWLQAAKEAQSKKDKARAAYDSDKADGITNASSFTQWVQENDPAFCQAYLNFQATEAAYLAAFKNIDSSGLEEWAKKRNTELAPLKFSSDLDKSQYIIYTGEE